jgi:hypothetical protein
MKTDAAMKEESLATSQKPAQLSSAQKNYPAPKPTGYNQSEIEKIAGFVGQALGFSSGGELSPLVTKLGGQIQFLDTEAYLFSGNMARIVISGPRDFIIFLHKLGGLFHNRFAIAHELGHYFLHSNMGETKITATHNESSVLPAEWEATVFAAALLMPRSEVKRLEKSLSDYDLSAKFSVSLEAVSNWKKLLDA